MPDLPAWMALAWHSGLSHSEQMRIAHGPGPDPEALPADALEREASDLEKLEDLGVRVLTLQDPDYPARLRADGPPVLQVAGHPELLGDDDVPCLAGHRGLKDLDQRTVIVLSKGMLKAKTLLRTLHEPLRDGTIALVSAEPPRATWNRLRDHRRDELARRLRS